MNVGYSAAPRVRARVCRDVTNGVTDCHGNEKVIYRLSCLLKCK